MDDTLGEVMVLAKVDVTNIPVARSKATAVDHSDAASPVSYLPDAALVNPMEILVNHETGDEVVIAVRFGEAGTCGKYTTILADLVSADTNIPVVKSKIASENADTDIFEQITSATLGKFNRDTGDGTIETPKGLKIHYLNKRYQGFTTVTALNASTSEDHEEVQISKQHTAPISAYIPRF